MGYTTQLKIDDQLPGVITRTIQVADFSILDDNQFKRVVNAIDRGTVRYSGYVANLVRLAADKCGECRPIAVSTHTYGGGYVSFHNVEHLPQEMFTDAINVANVRFELWKADAGRVGYYGSRTSGFEKDYYNREVLTLYGYPTPTQSKIVNDISKLINTHAPYRESLRRLKDFVLTRPTFQVMDKEY